MKTNIRKRKERSREARALRKQYAEATSPVTKHKIETRMRVLKKPLEQTPRPERKAVALVRKPRPRSSPQKREERLEERSKLHQLIRQELAERAREEEPGKRRMLGPLLSMLALSPNPVAIPITTAK